jgi:hypothetical protein
MHGFPHGSTVRRPVPPNTSRGRKKRTELAMKKKEN